MTRGRREGGEREKVLMGSRLLTHLRLFLAGGLAESHRPNSAIPFWAFQISILSASLPSPRLFQLLALQPCYCQLTPLLNCVGPPSVLTMPPRLRLPSGRLSQPVRQSVRCRNEVFVLSRSASTATATTPGTSPEQLDQPQTPISGFHKTQPPSHRNPEFRRSQLLRQYTSLIRTSPLMIFFQHNNLKSVEWVAIRRELAAAMRQVDKQIAAEGRNLPELAPHIKVNILQTSIFDVALRIVEYFRPQQSAQPPKDVDPVSQTSLESPPYLAASKDDPSLSHDLSRTAHDAVTPMKRKHEMSTILLGPVAAVSIPAVSPEHMKAALSILCPKEVGLRAPRRKTNPGWFDLTVQDGIQKLNLLAARADSDVMDVEKTKWVTSIEGGMDGLRSQLVRALQSVGANITNTLEGASKSLYLTLESRRSVLEEEQKGPEEKTEEKKDEQ